MHVYRPLLRPRQAQLFPVAVLAATNNVGAATTSMTVSVQAAGVVLATAAVAASFATQAQEGNFLSNGVGAASVLISASATGISVGKVSEGPVGLTVTASASGKAVRAGEGSANASMTMSVQAVGVRIVPGQQPGAQVVDMAAFIERKVERAAEYRFSGGGRTRDFYQRGH